MKKTASYFIYFILIKTVCFSQSLPKPNFSLPAGFYADSISLSITSTVPASQIRYTLNGSEPTITSMLYSGPIKIKNRSHLANSISTIKTNPSFSYPHPGYDILRANTRGWLQPFDTTFKATVIKAKVFKIGFVSDSTKVASYLIKEGTSVMFSLPVISISLDSLDLFDYTNGMYVYGKDSVIEGNYNNDTVEKKAYIEFFESSGIQKIGQFATIKNHGNGGRHAPLKSLQLKAESSYGKGYFENKFFQNSEVTKHDRLLLRNGGHRLDCMPSDDVGGDFFKSINNITQNNRQCIVLLNGEYWGVETLKELVDNNYFLRKYNIPKTNCVILQQTGTLNEGLPGDEIPYTNLLSFLSANSLSTTPNYNYVTGEMDIESFTDFQCAEIFIGNGDWPDNNVKYWRFKRPINDLSLNNHLDGRWRWMIYDLDASFGGDCSGIYPASNSLIRALDPTFTNYTLPLRSLISNSQYKIDFINRYADLLNSNFLSFQLVKSINKTSAAFNPEMPQHVARWRYPSIATNLVARDIETPSTTKWNTIISGMLNFAGQRANKTRKNFLSFFSLADTVKITINVNDTTMGKVKINSLYLDNWLIKNTSKVYPWTGTYYNGNPIAIEAMAYPGFKFEHWNLITDISKTVTKNVTSDTLITAYFIPDPTFMPLNYLILNEVLVLNSTTISDNYLQKDSWIEIYNPNAFSVDLAGFYLSNDASNKKKFQIKNTSPQTIIKPHDFLIIWADNDTLQGNLHTNFKLNFSGDSIYLTLPNGKQTADSVMFNGQTSNVSYGRQHDGDPNWIFFSTPTPNASNVSVGIKELKQNKFIVYPNPSSFELNITTPINCSIYDVFGRNLGDYKNTSKINISSLMQGVYFLKSEDGFVFKFIKSE